MPPESSNDQTVLDAQGALKRLGGRRQLYAKVLRKFVPEYGKAHETIINHMTVGEREAASRMAHSVKGAAAAIGAEGLRQVAAQLETAIKGQFSDIDNLLSIFQSRFEQTEEAISRYLEVESRK